MTNRRPKKSSTVLARPLFAQIKSMTWDKREARYRVDLPGVDLSYLSSLVARCRATLAIPSDQHQPKSGGGPTEPELISRDLNTVALAIVAARNRGPATQPAEHSVAALVANIVAAKAGGQS